MEALYHDKKLLPVGETVFFDGLWHVISFVNEEVYELLSISSKPMRSEARISGVSINGPKNKNLFITGKPVSRNVSRSNTTVMDTVFFASYNIHKGQNIPFIDYGYYLSCDHRFMQIFDKNGNIRIFGENTQIKKVFFFD